MLTGLLVAAALLAPDPQPAPAAASAVPAPATSDCKPQVPDMKTNEVVVCAPKPKGYRIDPDLLAAKRAKREALVGPPKRPERLKDNSCQVVGPAPCMDAPTINLLAAAATAAQMAERLSKGQEVGSMFVTNPQTDEYHYYLRAKQEREAKEAAAAAKAKAKAAADAAAAARN